MVRIPAKIMQLLYGKRLATTDGEIQVPGLERPITIQRDRYGIVYISAQTELDAWYGLGFCQGQDRSFQLEMLLRAVRGTLSELFGKPLLPIDRLSRRLGFLRAAQGHYDQLEPGFKAYYDVFAQGINDGQQFGSTKPAHEYSILRSQPSPWTGNDVLGGLNYIALSLTAWNSKLARMMIILEDGPEAVADLEADYGADYFVSTPPAASAGPALNQLSQDMERLLGVFGKGASNNWVLSSERTATGRPLLANDPHLGAALPAPWYLAHLSAPDFTIAGASFIGAPLIPAGHTPIAAWGVTAGLCDNVELYLEKLGPDGTTSLEGENYQPCRIHSEVFRVKDSDTFEDRVVFTPRGPIISDLLPDCPMQISFQAAWHCPSPASGFVEYTHMDSFEEFRQGVYRIHLVSQNLVYADINGNIGWTLSGDIPQRVGAWGAVPLPGWDEDYHWLDEPFPLEQVPFTKNPETGFIATANNKPIPDSDGPYLGRDFVAYRHARIVELLANRSDWDILSTQKMQLDQYSIPWREMKAAVLSAPILDEDTQTALCLLAEWDGKLTADSKGGAVYEYFVIEMVQRMVKAKAPKSAGYVLGTRFPSPFTEASITMRIVETLSQHVRTQPKGWFPAGWQAEIGAALGSTTRRLRSELGDETDRWSWGKIHELVLNHPLGQVELLKDTFNRGPFPMGGDHNTVAQAGVPINKSNTNVTGLANLRMVLDVGNWEDNRFVICGGQSGNPFSPHYDDLLAYWLRGEMVQMAWSQEAISQAAVESLVLRQPEQNL